MQIETERLRLRPVEHADLEPWAALLADSSATRLLHFPDPHSREHSAGLLDRTIERADGDVAMYAVLLRATGETVGFVGYAPRTLDWGDELELGWSLLPAFHGRGYATEAARAVRPLVPGRVVSLIRVENRASQNVARRLGMRHERDLTFVGFATGLWVGDEP
jgi:RimJ/RimL family protein N-acetyltransferase